MIRKAPIGYREPEEGELIRDGDVYISNSGVVRFASSSLNRKYNRKRDSLGRYRKLERENMKNNGIKFYVDPLGSRDIIKALVAAGTDAGYNCYQNIQTGSMFYYRKPLFPYDNSDFGGYDGVPSGDYKQYSIERAIEWFKNNPKQKQSTEYTLACNDKIVIKRDGSITYKNMNVSAKDIENILFLRKDIMA